MHKGGRATRYVTPTSRSTQNWTLSVINRLTVDVHRRQVLSTTDQRLSLVYRYRRRDSGRAMAKLSKFRVWTKARGKYPYFGDSGIFLKLV